MKTLHTLLMWPHIGLGFVALAAFWVPVATKKGASVHQWAGRVFNASMLAVSFSAFGMSAASLTAPDTIHPGVSVERVRTVALFLGYLGLVSVVIVHNGWVTARRHRDPDSLRAPWRRALNIGLIVASAASVVYGVMTSSIVMAALSPVGFLTGKGWLEFTKKIDEPRAWFFEHMSSMLAGGIAVHTAFLAGGGTRFLPAFFTELGWKMWLLPTAIGVPAIILWSRHYRRQFS